METGDAEHLGTVPALTASRWPILTAWRWLVVMPSREADLSVDTGGHSAAGVALERECDLGHRGVMPKALGRAIVKLAEGRRGSVGVMSGQGSSSSEDEEEW